MRLALALVAALVAHSAQAAGIYTLAEPPSPADYIKIVPQFDDHLRPNDYLVHSLSDPYSPDTNSAGWQAIRKENINHTPPPDWVMSPFWVPRADAGFSLKLSFVTHPIPLVDLTEFIAAGDTELGLTLKGSLTHEGGAWGTMTWQSPNLGTVTRSYTIIPEPAGLLLFTVAGVGMAWSRRREPAIPAVR